LGFSGQLTSAQLSLEPAPPQDIIANANTLDLPSTGSPQMCRGDLRGTLIAKTNAEVIHSCDIATQMKRSILWERLKHSRLVQVIRDAIEAIKKALGFSPDAISQRYIEIAQWLAGKLKTLSDMLKQFNDWITISVEYAKTLRAIIDWIMSLPARLKASLQECLQQFLNGITSAVSDVLSLPGAENTPENSSLMDALKDVKTNFESLTVQTNITLQLPSQVLTAISTPASAENINSINSVITDFIEKQNENVVTDPLNSMTLA
jgi:predicted DNA binding CopG/RHH family protein